MLVLAIDTATEVVTVGLLTVPDGDQPPSVLAERAYPGARQHGEQLMPSVLEVCAAAGHELSSVDAVVCGVGPGPFTGLRVGMVSAASIGDALDIPVYGVCSLDAVADGLPSAGLLVVSDARRREVYWAAYQVGPDGTARRTEGPGVDAPAALAARVAELGVTEVAGPVAAAHAETLGLPVRAMTGPTVAGLVAAARDQLREGRTPSPLEPLYLRRPDAVPPTARKRVTAG